MARWRGLVPRATGTGLVMAGSRLHGRGMREPLRVVGLSAAGEVVASAVLLPGTLCHLAPGRLVMELPLGGPAPRVGWRLDLARIVAP